MQKRDIIKFRRGTAEEWSNSLPQPGGEVLRLGEPGYEKDTGKLKVGDGVTPWNSLPYLQAENEQDIILQPEDVQDVVGDSGFLKNGLNINTVYNDENDELIINTVQDPSFNSLNVDNLSLDGNAISSTGDLYISQSQNNRVIIEGAGDVIFTDGGLNAQADIEANNITSRGDVSGLDANFTSSLTLNNVNVSLEGHTHLSNDITDFDDSVNALIPVINNPSDNRLLTSSGTNTGINAESNLTFDEKILQLNCVCSEGTSGFYGVGDGNIVNFRANQFFDNSAEPPRLIFRRTRGSENNKQITIADDGIFAIRGETIDYNGDVTILGGIRMEITDPASPTSLNPGARIFLRTSSGGDNLLDKTLMLNSDGVLSNTGPIECTEVAADSANFDSSLTVNNVNVSLEGHTHNSIDITDSTSFGRDILTAPSYAAQNKLGWELLTTDITAKVGGQYLANPKSSIPITILYVTDPATANVGDFYTIIKYADSGTINVGGVDYYSDSNEILYRIYKQNIDLTYSWETVKISTFYDVIDKLSFDTTADPTLFTGEIGWDPAEGTVDVGLENDVSIHIGEHNLFRIRNETANTIYAGQAVYASDVHNNILIEATPYTADGSIREIRFMGLLLSDVDTNQKGYAISFGHIEELDTRGNGAVNGAQNLYAADEPAWVEGDILYIHPTIPGKLTKVEPKHSISVAIVLYVHQNNGRIFVRPISYGHLSDNHDVNVSGVADGQFLKYDASTDYWVASSSGNFTSLTINDAPVVKSDISSVPSGTTVDNVVILSQESYNSIAPQSGVVYLISEDTFQGDATVIDGTTNNYNPGVVTDTVRISGINTPILTGLSYTDYNNDAGLFINVGTNDIIIKHNDSNSSAANRFLVSWAGDYNVSANGGSFLAVRDKTDNVWRIV